MLPESQRAQQLTHEDHLWVAVSPVLGGLLAVLHTTLQPEFSVKRRATSLPILLRGPERNARKQLEGWQPSAAIHEFIKLHGWQGAPGKWPWKLVNTC